MLQADAQRAFLSPTRARELIIRACLHEEEQNLHWLWGSDFSSRPRIRKMLGIFRILMPTAPARIKSEPHVSPELRILVSATEHADGFLGTPRATKWRLPWYISGW